MIYSDDINRICALCQNAEKINDEEIRCRFYGKSMSGSSDACKKFAYDIFKKQVRRKRKLKTNFSADDFKL